MKLRPGSAAEFEKSLANRATRDVEPHVFLDVRPPEGLNDFGGCSLGGLMCPSRSFVVKPNDSLAEHTQNKDQLALGVVESFLHEHTFLQRHLLTKLSQSLDFAAMESEVVGCRGPLFIKPGPE